uniref:TAZ-type domain-containing protein n=2 Tax=Caenorhabditis tropicalis TaxID=1561998 RepID=A0A1I7V3N0_9PELO
MKFKIISFFSNAKCNSTVAVSCFAELFGMISEVCQQREISFRCVHYTFLDECFEARVGKCDAGSVAKVGAIGYKQALSGCHSSKKQKAEGTLPILGAPAQNFPSPVQLISALGYLQTQCSLSRSKNCSSDHVHNIMTQCEEQMKPLAGYPQIKIDTSKKLLMYDETDKERECLVVRSTLSEMYSLHHANCYHSLVTRCLCERLRFDVQCGINCDQLEPTSPDQDTLAWDEWKEARLVHGNGSDFKRYATIFSILFVLSITALLL